MTKEHPLKKNWPIKETEPQRLARIDKQFDKLFEAFGLPGPYADKTEEELAAEHAERLPVEE